MALKQSFKSAIERGAGEAHLILQQNKSIDFSKEIIHAATHNLAYDPQCEGGRANYIYELINLSAHKEVIIKTLFSVLLSKKDDSYGLNQLCEIARLYAQDGNTKARKVLYKRFQKNLRPGYTYCGNDSILALDGIDGLLMIADLIGQILQKDPDDWEDGTREKFFQEKNPTINVFQRLRTAAKNNKNIETYLHSIKANKQLRSKVKKREPFTYALIKERIENKTIKYISALITKELTHSDLVLLANDFLKEKNHQKLEIYLRVFSRIKFPLDYAPILKVAKSRYTKKNGLLYFAIKALSLFKAKEIRQFVLEKIASSKYPDRYVGLLALNYQRGDQKVFLRIIEKTNNKDRIHALAIALTDIYETIHTTECKKPVEAIYEKLTCGLHREDLVKILIANNVLSKKIEAEIQ